jgi:hypothetical protein
MIELLARDFFSYYINQMNGSQPALGFLSDRNPIPLSVFLLTRVFFLPKLAGANQFHCNDY